MKIVKAELYMVNLEPKSVRSDAIQSFVSQETPIVRLHTDTGLSGTGYSYTIGSGGSSIFHLLKDHLLGRLIGRDPLMIERIWRELLFAVHAVSVGPVVSLALCAIDTALWDLKCRLAGEPLYKAAGGAKTSIPVYSTEGGWLHLSAAELVDNVTADREAGFGGSKLKLGASPAEDAARLRAVRAAVGGDYALMTDCNQAFSLSEMRQRAALLEPAAPCWIEEPFPADDVSSHEQLCRSTSIAVAAGESLYSLSQIREYLQRGALDIVQIDAGRIGGITPWLKAAHLAEAFNRQVCPHFLMELHVSLCCAVSCSRWLEYIPQLDLLLTEPVIRVQDGRAAPPEKPGLGLEWDWNKIRGSACAVFTAG